MPKNKIPKFQTGVTNFDPLNVEDQAKFNDTNSEEYINLKEWYDRRLNELWYLALGRKELKEAFCATAEKLKKKLRISDKSEQIWLLTNFAALARWYKPKDIVPMLVNMNKGIRGTYITDEAMNNRISKAIKEIDLDDLPEWTHEAINSRRELGKKLHKK
jgi:hypothetical protein